MPNHSTGVTRFYFRPFTKLTQKGGCPHSRPFPLDRYDRMRLRIPGQLTEQKLDELFTVFVVKIGEV